MGVRNGGRHQEKNVGHIFRRNSAEIPATNRSQEISSTGDIFKITPLPSYLWLTLNISKAALIHQT